MKFERNNEAGAAKPGCEYPKHSDYVAALL
jgi:hypothetical protein